MRSNIAGRVVLASPELRMAPLGSDNLYARHKALLKQHTLTKENIGLDIGVHYKAHLPQWSAAELPAGVEPLVM